METNASSVVTSLRALAELEDERIARERERRLEAIRAKEAAEARRREEETDRRRREEDERVAVTTAALERVRLEHEAERRREEREERARIDEIDARRAANERLRAAEHHLAAQRGASRGGTLLRVAHGVVTAVLALAVVACLLEVRDARAAQSLLGRTVDEQARSLRDARAENDELARDFGVALEAARNATHPPPVMANPIPASEPPVTGAPHHHESPVRTPPPSYRRCDAHDPLCGDL